MAENATAERPNKVHITDAGPSRKKVKIEVPKETVAEQMSQHLDTLSVEAELPGFRKGHVPRRLLEKKFGGMVRKNAKEQMVAAAFSKAVEEHKLRVIGQPTSEKLAEIEVEDGKPLVFEVEIEVQPEFKLPSLEGVPVKRPKIEVEDKLVESEVQKLCVTEGRLQERDSAEPGDYMTGHARLLGPGGKTFFEQDGIVVQVPPEDREGKGMIVGLMVDDLADQLKGVKIAAKSVIKTKGPESHEIEDLRGENVSIEFTPARIDRIVPATVEELTARFGFPDADTLREQVKQRLQQRAVVEQHAVMRQQAARWLLDNTEMELPERVTAQQAARSLERKRLELMYRGMDPVKVEEQIAAMRANSAADAVRELKLLFIIDRAAEELNVRVSDMEVNGRISQIAQERGERPEKLRQQLIQNNQISGIYTQIREHKTMDAIVSKAKVEEVSLAEFQSSMADAAKAHKEKAKGHKAKAEHADEGDKPAKAKPAKAKEKDEDDDKPAKKSKK